MPKASKSESNEKSRKPKKSAKPEGTAGIPSGTAAPKAAGSKATAPKRITKKSTKKSLSSLARPKRRRPFTNDDIALRAYYIAEQRITMGWPGDEAGDWLEAERQLVAEAAKR